LCRTRRCLSSLLFFFFVEFNSGKSLHFLAKWVLEEWFFELNLRWGSGTLADIQRILVFKVHFLLLYCCSSFYWDKDCGSSFLVQVLWELIESLVKDEILSLVLSMFCCLVINWRRIFGFGCWWIWYLGFGDNSLCWVFDKVFRLELRSWWICALETGFG
jgi:hypothetical protein